MDALSVNKPDGYVSLSAGTGFDGLIDGPLLQAEFNFPSGIIFNKFDDALYIVEWIGNYVRRFSSDCIIAGNGKKSDSDGEGSRAQFHRPRR